jgi:hypothetical protein
LLFETDHFRYHSDADWHCQSFPAWLEHHYATLSATLGTALMAGDKIDYYQLASGDEIGAFCGEVHGSAPAGCYRYGNGSIFSRMVYHPHELVHAYSDGLGTPPFLFREGLAVVLGGGIAAAIDTSVSLEALIDTQVWRSLRDPDVLPAYAAAAAFTRSLVDRHGWAPLLAFYASAPDDAALARQAFVASFGEDYESALGAWRQGPAVTSEDIPIHLAECSSPEIAPAGESFESLSCTERPDSRLYPMGFVRRISVPERAGMVLRVRSATAVQASMRGCDHTVAGQRSDFGFVPEDGEETREVWMDLAAADYWFMIRGAPAEPITETAAEEDALAIDPWGPSGPAAVSTHIDFELTPPLFADRCSDAPTRRVDPTTQVVVFAGSLAGARDDHLRFDGSVDVTTKIEVAQARHAASLPFVRSDVDDWTLCADDCPARLTFAVGNDARCAGPSDDPLLEPGKSYSLVLTGTPSELGYAFGLALTPR